MKVQTPETLWGVIKLYLALTLFALPLGYALDDLQWTHTVSNQGKIVFLWGTAVATTATIYRLFTPLIRGTSKLDEADLKKMPKPGATPYTLVREWYKRFTGKDLDNKWIITNKENPERWAEKGGYNLNEEEKETLTRLLCSFVIELNNLEDNFNDTAQILEEAQKLRNTLELPTEESWDNAIDQIDESLLLSKGIKEQFLLWYPGEQDTSLSNIIKTLGDDLGSAQFNADKLNDMAMEMNFPPQQWVKPANQIIQEYLQPVNSLFEKPLRTLTPRIIVNKFKSELAAIGSLIPDDYKEKAPDGTILIADSVTRLRKAALRMSQRMSGVQPTGGEILNDLETTTLRNSINPKYFPSTGGMTAGQIFSAFTNLNKDRLEALTQGKQPMGQHSSCTHPEDLSTILIGDDTQEWPDSLQQVQDLLTTSQRPAQTGGNQAERLFSSNDVPKLTDEDDYWTYRRSFEIFASAVTVTPLDIPVAISRILNRYEGKRREYMMAYDVGNNIKLTWTPTWRAILHYMDARFLDRDAYLELFKKWITLRPNDKLWGQGFIAEFDRLRMTLNQIAIPQRKTVISNDKSLERLIDKLPTKVRNAFRHNHPNAEYQLMDTTDTTTLENIYDWIIDDWKYLKSQGDLGPIKETKKTSTSHSGTPAQNVPGTPRVHPVWGTCNKPCWDEETIVPNGHRGKYMNITRGKDLICPHCRRRKEEHGGHPTGCQHHGEHRFHGPRSNSSDPSGNGPGDQ